jgi:Domain of Unknown Function (DUF1080)
LIRVETRNLITVSIMKNKILTLVLGAALLGQTATIFAQDSEKGFKKIFNGKDLKGWHGAPDLWSVRDGAITGETTPEHPAKENTFLIWTNGAPADFELRCSFLIRPGDAKGFSNSGIQYRSRVVKPEYWVVSGYQADMEAGSTYTGILYEEKARGILAKRGEKVVIDANGKINVVGSTGRTAAEVEASIKHGEWNTYDIIAKGNHLIQKINGQVTVDVTDQQEAKAAKSGIIALQIHAGPSMFVQFKDIRVKMLK